MLNVVKTNLLILSVAIASCFAVGCSSTDNEKKDKAKQLIEDIKLNIDKGNAAIALALMDTIDSVYSDQIEERKIVKALRPKAIELSTIEQIAHTDSMIALAQMELTQLTPQMKHIDGNGLEGYYVVSNAYDPNFIKSSKFEARVNDSNNMFYIVAIVNGRSIGINQVGLNSTDGECRSAQINSRANQGGVIEGSELASFMPEEVDTLGRWAYDNMGSIKTGVIYGNKGNVKFNITPNQAKAIGTAWRFANQKAQERNALIHREKLDRMLQIARDQAANATIDTII